MILAQYFVEFMFYSFLGWVWESIYCTYKEKHWQDRGFLFGPYCPIYGSCVVAAEIVFGHILPGDLQEQSVITIFIISYIGSAIAEFGTSWVLEKRFHARWWDYSKMPLNIQGRICVPVSICFGLAGIFCVKVLIPWMTGLHNDIPALLYEGLALALAMIFGADFALTEASLNALLKRMEEYKADFNERAQENYIKISTAPERLQAAVNVQREEFREKRTELGEELESKKAELEEGLKRKGEEVRLRGEELLAAGEEFKERREEAAEERRIRTERIAEEFFDKINSFQKSKLQNMKLFVPGTPEDAEFFEKLKDSISKNMHIKH